MTALLVHDRICKDAARTCPECLEDFRNLALDTNLRLAIQAVKTDPKGAFPYLKRLQENTRRHFSREAFARFWDKKDRAAVLALYGNVPLFWGLLALWYQLQKGRKDG